MNEQLQNALRELAEAGAMDVPEVAEIVGGPDESEWSGTCDPTGTWELVKHRADSYTTHTSNEE